MSKAVFKGRNFLFTLNEPERWDELLTYVKSLKGYNYGIACLEKAPTTGHKHIHYYAQFKGKVDVYQSKVAGARIDKCLGSAQKNIDYVRKTNEPEKRGDIIYEEGEAKHKGGPTIKELKEMPREDRQDLPGMYFNIVNKINAEEDAELKGSTMYKEMKVHWFWGNSGLGKTRKAYELIGERTFNEVKFDGNFWHGVGKASIALYDDFRASDMKPRELINFIDYHKHVMNIKGGSTRNEYTEIFITSIESPEEIYKNVEGEPRKQWLRRITEILHFEEA